VIVTTFDEVISGEQYVSGRLGRAGELFWLPTGWGSRSTTRSSRRAPSSGFTIDQFEANYCIAGHGEVVVVREQQDLRDLYALDQHNEYILRAINGDLRLVCVFNPALAGQEKHRADGSHALAEKQ